jgi:ankyrin repeat protein
MSNAGYMAAMSDWVLSKGAYDVVFEASHLKVLLAEHPEVNVNLYRDWQGFIAMHRLIGDPDTDLAALACAALLLDHKADINTRSGIHGNTCLMRALMHHVDEATLFLLQRGIDVSIKNRNGRDALCVTLRERFKHPLMTFVLLCTGSNVKHVTIDTVHIGVTQLKLDAAIAHYKNIQAFIESTHDLLKTTLSDEVKVDTRVGREDNGIYHEPLERALEYLGLSMSTDQVVNTSIDGNEHMRALIPHQPRSAKHWYDKYTLDQQQENTPIHEVYEQVCNKEEVHTF